MKSGIKRGKQEFFPIFPCLDFEFVSDFGIRISNFLFEDLFERGLSMRNSRNIFQGGKGVSAVIYVAKNKSNRILRS